MYCSQCGNRVSEGDAFCSVCGTPNQIPPAYGQPEEQAQQQPLIYQQPAAQAPPPQPPMPAQMPKKKKSFFKTPWPYIGAAVIIAVAVLAVTGTLSSIVAFITEPPKVVIEFEDARLEKVIRDELKIFDDDITTEDAEQVTTLNLSKAKIKNIEPLAYFTALTELNLNDNQINDISALGALVKLEKLDLGNNSIEDISMLGTLVELKQLVIRGNNIRDAGAISSLVSLTDLSAEDNIISTLPTLSKLTSLQNLNLRNNQVSDISALSDCTGLLELVIDNNPVETISAVAGLSELKHVSLKGTGIKDISAVAGKMQIDMDSPEGVDIELSLGDYFKLSQITLPVNIGEAKLTWSTSDENVVRLEEDTAYVTNVQDYVFMNFLKTVTLTGVVENTDLAFTFNITVKHDAYGIENDDTKAKYKNGSYEMRGYPRVVKPSVANVVAIDYDYEIFIGSGKITTFAFRAYVNDEEWKNFGDIDVSVNPKATVRIDFGEPISFSKFWLVCTDKRSGSWSYYAEIDKIYYATKEIDIAALLAA